MNKAQKQIVIMIDVHPTNGISVLNAGGGEAGELTPELLMEQYGGAGILYITNKRPK